MERTKHHIVTLMVFLSMGPVGLCTEPFAQGPYLGQTPPGPVAQVFAPGLICDIRPRQWEAWPSFSADGNAFCFNRLRYVYITENTDQGWTTPKRVESIPYHSVSCCLSPDANRIYFTYALVQPLSKRNLYCCDRTAQGWGTPKVLPPPLSSARELTCSIAMNNNLYIGSGRKGHDGRSLVWVAPFVNSTWSRADHIPLNHPHAGDPGIAPDESFMVFTSMNLPGSYGKRDIYLTLHLPDGTWSTPRNMGPRVNTAYFEHSPRISPDKKYLFFTRATGWDPTKDNADIYWVALKDYLPESHR